MKTMMVASDENLAIGYDDNIPWSQSTDMKRFRELTMGGVVVMGSKTFDSIGKPLPGRTNVVISRTRKDIPGCVVYTDPSMVLENHPDCFIIGGGQIYSWFFPYVDKIEHTLIHTKLILADTWVSDLGNLSPDEWVMTSRTDHLSDEKNQHPYSFVTYVRKTDNMSQ
jgi:dihydrofolate reductase